MQSAWLENIIAAEKRSSSIELDYELNEATSLFRSKFLSLIHSQSVYQPSFMRINITYTKKKKPILIKLSTVFVFRIWIRIELSQRQADKYRSVRCRFACLSFAVKNGYRLTFQILSHIYNFVVSMETKVDMQQKIQ